jgi:hypothetical protein
LAARLSRFRLVDLHLEGGACVPGIQTNDFEPEIAEFMHEPWRHRSGLDPYSSVTSRMPADQNADLFWNRGALAPPEYAASLSTAQIAVIFCETSNPTKGDVPQFGGFIHRRFCA